MAGKSHELGERFQWRTLYGHFYYISDFLETSDIYASAPQ
jgi:hypothetical protein